MNNHTPQIGESYIMSDPIGDDCWHFGGFAATIVDIVNNMAIVEDGDSDFFSIEVGRLTELV